MFSNRQRLTKATNEKGKQSLPPSVTLDVGILANIRNDLSIRSLFCLLVIQPLFFFTNYVVKLKTGFYVTHTKHHMH